MNTRIDSSSATHLSRRFPRQGDSEKFRDGEEFLFGSREEARIDSATFLLYYASEDTFILPSLDSHQVGSINFESR